MKPELFIVCGREKMVFSSTRELVETMVSLYEVGVSFRSSRPDLEAIAFSKFKKRAPDPRSWTEVHEDD